MKAPLSIVARSNNNGKCKPVAITTIDLCDQFCPINTVDEPLLTNAIKKKEAGEIEI